MPTPLMELFQIATHKRYKVSLTGVTSKSVLFPPGVKSLYGFDFSISASSNYLLPPFTKRDQSVAARV